jgi:8-oxo-dGTP diphosphatase
MQYTIFKEPPSDFAPTVEIATCYCEFEGRRLFLKRHPNKYQGDKWGSPGGKIEKGETPREAIIRELYEEVGFVVDFNDKALEAIGTIYIRIPHLDYINHLLRIKYQSKPEIILGLDEHLEYRWVDFDEALQLPLIVSAAETLSIVANIES